MRDVIIVHHFLLFFCVHLQSRRHHALHFGFLQRLGQYLQFALFGRRRQHCSLPAITILVLQTAAVQEMQRHLQIQHGIRGEIIRVLRRSGGQIAAVNSRSTAGGFLKALLDKVLVLDDLRVERSYNIWLMEISVADPDSHAFGPPGSGSTSQRYGSGSCSGSGSGSFYHHAKIVRKTLSGHKKLAREN
jgi:hypothetical protein